MDKSSRHRKIIGEFGESVISNWLSRSGFEVVSVDHTGIDLIAYHRATGQRLGVTVKSRARESGKDNISVNIFNQKKNDRKKVLDACGAFACLPWLGVYVEGENYANIYLTSLENYDAKYRRPGKVVDVWGLTPRNRLAYVRDRSVKNLRIVFHATNWGWSDAQLPKGSVQANPRLQSDARKAARA
ncbi:MAG: hypothetical protein HYY78_14010 [Betaproteobacteria bacterium]|nr:hypothetical protein [Betaproteobacteria bacterium]